MTPIFQFNGQPIKPRRAICIGRNYAAHAAELGNALPEDMLIFFKPQSSISKQLRSNHLGEVLHYETELVFLLDGDCIVGLGIGFDLTKRETQSRLKTSGLPWERAKAFDGAAVLSDFIPLPQGLVLTELEFSLHIDNKLIQFGRCEDMIHSPQSIVDEVSQFSSIGRHDVLFSGTPAGVGVVLAGSVYTAAIMYRQKTILELELTAV